MSWQAQAMRMSLPMGAQHLELGPHLCQRFHLSRANELPLAAGNLGPPREG
jgi:hypothetical protein